MKYKTCKWFREGDKVPFDAKLIDTRTIREKVRPSEGGFKWIYFMEFLYEYSVGEE